MTEAAAKPTKVKMMTNHLPCGQEVEIMCSPTMSTLEVKRQLQEKTGVPIEHQKLMLAGINQLAMGDKRTNIKFSHAGTASSLFFAMMDKQT